MTAQTPDLDHLLQRLEKLERQNRWMKVAGSTLVLLAGAAWLMGQVPRSEAQPDTKTGEPQTFVVQDANGNKRAWLGMGKEGPQLLFFAEDGRSRAELGTVQDGLVIRLRDEGGKVRAGLSVEKDGVAIAFVSKLGTQQGVNALRQGPGLIFSTEGARRGAPKP